jgi:tetratricopeptide (TPR) repeat protein
MGEMRGMLEQYEEFRNEIRSYIAVRQEQDFEEAKNGLFEYLDLLQVYNEKYILDDYWFVYYNLGLIYKKVGDYENALKYTKTSLNFWEDERNLVKSKWLLSVIHEDNMKDNNIETLSEIFEIYKDCKIHYKKLNDWGKRLSILFNINKLNKNYKQMMKTIRIFDKKMCISIENDFFNSEYGINYILLRGMCEDLINLHMQNNNLFLANKTIKYINNKKMKSELKNYIINLQ